MRDGLSKEQLDALLTATPLEAVRICVPVAACLSPESIASGFLAVAEVVVGGLTKGSANRIREYVLEHPTFLPPALSPPVVGAGDVSKRGTGNCKGHPLDFRVPHGESAPSGARSGLGGDTPVNANREEGREGDQRVAVVKSDSYIQEWPGIISGGNSPRVQALESVPGVMFNGMTPPEISKLTQLRVLNLGGNDPGSSIHPELDGLDRLEVLDLAHWGPGHELTGVIPPELGNLGHSLGPGLWKHGLGHRCPATQ